jgi:hypothetical protein
MAENEENSAKASDKGVSLPRKFTDLFGTEQWLCECMATTVSGNMVTVRCQRCGRVLEEHDPVPDFGDVGVDREKTGEVVEEDDDEYYNDDDVGEYVYEADKKFEGLSEVEKCVVYLVYTRGGRDRGEIPEEMHFEAKDALPLLGRKDVYCAIAKKYIDEGILPDEWIEEIRREIERRTDDAEEENRGGDETDDPGSDGETGTDDDRESEGGETERPETDDGESNGDGKE